MNNLFENESELRRRGGRDISCTNFRRATRRLFEGPVFFPEEMSEPERVRCTEKSIRSLKRIMFVMANPDKPDHPWARAYFSYMLHQLLCERCRVYHEQCSKKVHEELKRYIKSLQEKQNSQAS